MDALYALGVAFLDSITEVDSRVFFPRQLCSVFQLSIILEVFTRPPKLELARVVVPWNLSRS